MSRSRWQRWIDKCLGRVPSPAPVARRRAARFRPDLGALEDRVVPAGRLFAIPPGSSIVELSPATGAVLNSFAAPEPAGGGEVGLAFDGNHLFYINGGGSDTLFELDPDTGAVVDSDPVTGGAGHYDGLAFAAGQVFIQDSSSDQILVFDPVTDTVTRTLNPGADLVGGLAGATNPSALIGPINGGNLIAEMDPATGAITHTFAPGVPFLLGAAVVDGEIYLGAGNTNAIYRFSRGGEPHGQITPPTPVAALGGDDIAPAPGSQFVNGGFETGSTSGWVVFNAPNSGGTGFQAYVGPNPQGSSLPAPPEGTYAAYDNHSGPGSFILFQDVTLPAGQFHTLSLQVAYQNQFGGGFVTPDTLDYRTGQTQQFRIDVIRPGADLLSVAAADVLTNVFRTQVGDPSARGPFTVTAVLTPFAGQTVRLRVAVANNLFFLFAAVDDVRLTSTTAPPTGTVRGVKFEDLDGDGARDPGEPGLPGWTVYADLNNNRAPDPGEPAVVTGADGSYALTLSPGSYHLREAVQAGWVQTAPASYPFYATGNQGTQLITIDPVAGTATTVGQFGTDQTWAGAFTPDGSFWTIVRGSDPGEARLARVDPATGTAIPVGSPNWVGSPMIALEADAAGTLYGGSFDGRFFRIDTATGAATPIGNLGFTDVMDFAFDTAGVLWAVDGSNRLFRVDPATGAGTFVSNITGVDGSVMGLMADPKTGTLFATNYVFNSTLFALNPLTGTATRVGTNLGVPYPHGGDIGLVDSYAVTVTAGADLGGRDFGNHRNEGMVRGVKYEDLDGDGTRDAGEPGLPGWTVYADLNNNRALDAGEPSVVTGADGSYALTLGAGTYVLREVTQTGWRQTAPTAGTFFSVRVENNVPTVYEMGPSGATVSSFAAPATVGIAGPQGLADAGGSLFYVDGSGGAGGTSAHTLYELDPATGAVLDADALPATQDLAGLAYLGGMVYVQVYPTDEILVFDPVADTVVNRFTVAADIAGGLTGADDRGLLYATNFDGTIYGIDPGTGAVVQTMLPGVGQLAGGLAYLDGELIAAPFTTDSQAFRIDPGTGAVLGTITLGSTGIIGALGGDGAPAPVRVAVTAGQELPGRDFGGRQNSAPVAVDDAAGVTEDFMLGIPGPGVLANDTDADPRDSKVVVAVNGSAAGVGQPVTLPSGARLTLRADGGYLYDQNGRFNGLRAGQTGTDSFTYTVRDGRGATATATVTVTVNGANDAPAAQPDTINTDEDTATSGNVLANDLDPDQGDTRAVVAVNGSAATVGQTVTLASGARLRVNADGTFAYDPTGAFDRLRAGETVADSFGYTMADGAGLTSSATATVFVTGVNDAPVAAGNAYTVAEDGTLIVDAPGVLINDTDVEGDVLAALLVAGPSHGSIALSANGSFRYAPAANYNGADAFTYKASDGAAESGGVTVSLTVTPVNDPPVAAGQSVTTAEDTPLSGAVSATDLDGDPLTYAAVTQPAHGTLTLNPNGAFTYTPAANYNGSDSFTFKANDGTAESNVATVAVTVSPVNDAPVGVPDPYATDEDTALTVDAPGVLANDTDIDGDSLTAVLVAGPSHGTLTLSANGSFTYTPAVNFNGSDAFTYAASDGTASSVATTVALTVRPVNDAPVANNASLSTAEDTPLTAAVVATDVDGDALTYRVVSNPAHGTLTSFNTTTGAFTYSPAADYNGTDSFTFKANDGTADSNTATESLTVTPVNDAPVANAASATIAEDSRLDGSVTATDVDGPTPTYSIVNGPSHGTLSGFNATTGAYTYTPAADYNGADSFTFKANDGSLDSNTATVSITVSPVNDAPVSAGDAHATAEDTALTVGAPGLLGNDTDVDGDTLSAVLVTGPAHGTLTLNSDGSFIYTPAANYNGLDSFTYKASDGIADSGPATVSLTVTAVPDVAGVVVNQGAAQRSRVTEFAVTFDSVVTLLPGAFTLTRTTDGLRVGVINVSTATVAGQTVATLTFAGTGTESGSLADGRWTLRVSAAGVRGSNGAAMSTAFTFGLHRLFGDADGDGDVDGSDESAFNAAFGRHQGQAGYVSYFDFDQDGDIDPRDRTQFRLRLGTHV